MWVVRVYKEPRLCDGTFVIISTATIRGSHKYTVIKEDINILRSRFASNAPSAVTVLYENAPATAPQTNAPFIRFSIPSMTTTRDSTGPNARVRTSARLYLSIFVPRQTGSGLALDLADQCASIFRDWRWTTAGNHLRCYLPETQMIDTETDWYQVRVSVPWESVRQS